MKGSEPLADPSTSSEKEPSKADAKPPPRADSADFANTRQHVAERQSGNGGVERFTNTRLNIALINDPKNGPRFTMTKRQAGLDEDEKPEQAEAKSETTSCSPETPTGSTRTLDGREASGTETPEIPAKQPVSEPSSRDTPAPKAAPAPGAAAAVAAGEPEGSASGPTIMPPPPAPADAQRSNEPPAKVQVDSSKTFVGPNGTYYDESWRWMDWRGTRQSWNWPAALSIGHWFAYRRLYAYAALYLLWLAGLAAAVVNDIPILALVVAFLLVIGLAGVYGNTLYFFAFRRAVDHVTEKGEGSYDERKSQLAAAGGISVNAACIMGAMTLAAIAGSIWLTHHLRGGLLINLWPF